MSPAPLTEATGSGPRTQLMAFCRSWLRSLFPERQQVRSTSPAKYTTRDLPISRKIAEAPLSVACEDKPFLVEKLDTQEQRSIPEESSPPSLERGSQHRAAGWCL